MSDSSARQRKRLVNFRVTDTEYDQLRAASAAQGRGISDFVRGAIIENLQRFHLHHGACCDTGMNRFPVEWLDRRLTSFETVLTRFLQALNPNAARGALTENDQ